MLQGNPIFNPIDEQNLFPIASLAGRVAMEGYSKKQTLAKLCMRLGEAFEGQVWATVLSETDDGRAFVRSMDRVTQRISNDPMTRQERALYRKSRGYNPSQIYRERDFTVRCHPMELCAVRWWHLCKQETQRRR